MPTIKQLPSATSVSAADVLPISQGGTTKALSVGQLLSSTQAALVLATGKLLGRVSSSAGGPEPVGLGAGLAMDSGSGSLVATGTDHLALPPVTALGTGDEVVVNSGGQAARMQATVLRGLFTAGTGVTIRDGTISASAGGSYVLPQASTTTLGGVMVDGTTITVSANGTISASFNGTLPPAAVSGASASQPLTLTGRMANGTAVSVTVASDAAGNAVISGSNVLFQLAGAVKVNGRELLSTAAIPASGGILATSGSAGTTQVATATQFEALMTAWLQGKATAPSSAPGWWNNGGIPTFS